MRRWGGGEGGCGPGGMFVFYMGGGDGYLLPTKRRGGGGCGPEGWGWLLTSHRLTRPVSCSRDQMLCKRAAFSGWLA